MNYNEISFKYTQNADATLNSIIKRKLGSRVFISQKQAIDKSKTNMILGIYIPQFIDDSKLAKRKLRYLKFGSVGILETKKEKDNIQVLLPKTEELIERISTKMNRLVFSVESTLLQSTYQKLVKIPLVSNSLDPIRDILVEIRENNEFDMDRFIRTRGEAKAIKYIQFLEGLELIRKSENKYIAGNQFNLTQKEFKGDEKKIYNLLLAYVLKNGLAYIKEYLRLTAITPYIKLSTSYYLPSSEGGSLLSLTQNMLIQYHSNIYGGKPLERKTYTHISHMVEAGIFNKEDGKFIIGNDDVLHDVETTYAKAF
jgi:hypothetical protein